MIDIADLKQRFGEDPWVIFDHQGCPLELRVPDDIGPVTLLVTEITDALKQSDASGAVTSSLDRSQVWSVAGFALNRTTLANLPDLVMTAADLYQTVDELSMAWQIKPLTEMEADV